MGSMYEAFIGLTRFLINLHTLNETDLENIHRKYFDESSFQIKIPSSVQINTDGRRKVYDCRIDPNYNYLLSLLLNA